MRTACITGATLGGLGFHVARQLIEQSNETWHIIVTCRTVGKGEEAVQTLRQTAHAGSSVEYIVCDMALFASVRACISVLAAKKLDVLICNAGVLLYEYKLTADGHESQLQVNVLSPFLMVTALAPTLAKGARIIIVSSDMHRASVGSEDPHYLQKLCPTDPYDGMVVYSHTKYLDILLTKYMATRLPSGVSIGAVTPGFVPSTGMTREMSWPMRFLHRHVLTWLPFAVSEDVGAGRIAQLASRDLDISGTYWSGGAIAPTRDCCQSGERQAQAWALLQASISANK